MRSTVERTGWTAIAGIALLAALHVLRVGAYPVVDGISYLDLSDAALDGRWRDFVNAYWSPLFPALLAAGRWVFGTSPVREAPVIALVNAAAAAVSALCFFSALRTLSQRGALPTDGQSAVATHIMCWCVFAAAVLRIVPLTLATPDLLVMTAQLAAFAAMLRARREARFGRFALATGIALGMGFLAKGAVLVLFLSYLVAFALVLPRGRRVRSSCLAALGFAVVATPWIAVLSLHEGTLTAGSVARLNLAWYVGGQSGQIPDPDAVGTASLPNQWARVPGLPAIYDFSPHAFGTYPPWSDPTWWHEGIVPRPTLSRLGSVLKDDTSVLWSLFGVPFLVFVSLLASSRLRRQLADARLTAALVLLAAAQVGVYWPVHVEVRFLGIAWLFAWLAVISIVVRPASRARTASTVVVILIAVAIYVVIPPAFGSPKELALALVVSALLAVAFAKGEWQATVTFLVLTTAANAPWCANVTLGIRNGPSVIHQRDLAIARTLHEEGIADGAALASVNATAPASWARLGRWHIASEVAHSRTVAFWRLSDAERVPFLRALTSGNIAAVIGVLDDSAPRPAGWIAVPGTRAVILPSSRVAP